MAELEIANAFRFHDVFARNEPGTDLAQTVDSVDRVNKMTKKILCPIDFSQGSARACKAAAELARALPAEIELLYVIQLPVLGLPATEAMSTPTFMAEMTASAERGLTQYKEELAASGVTISTLYLEGSPADVIVERARQLDAYLIVMGTHGRTGMQRLLLGSIAERVVRMASTPVLTVRVSE